MNCRRNLKKIIGKKKYTIERMIKTRLYSTSRKSIDHLWPQEYLHPTPYQIFNIEQGAKYDKKQLKKIYHSYVKLYHPDISTNVIICQGNKILTPQEKLQRFKNISVAYKQLLSGKIYSNPNNYYTQYDYPYSYQTYNNHNNINIHEPDPVDINPWHIMYLIMGTIVIWGGSIYLTNLQNSLHLSNQYTTNSQRIDEQDIQMAHWQELYDKYVGFSGAKMDRIRRFLWIRLWHQEGLDSNDNNNNNIKQSLEKNQELVENLIQSKK